MFDGEIPAGAAHASHDFIGNHQDTVAPANFRYLLQISGRRNDCAQRGSADRLEDEPGRFTGGFNGPLQLGRIFLTAVAAPVLAVIVTAIAIGDSYVGDRKSVV